MKHADNRLVTGAKLLELLFDESCRPSIVWLRQQRVSGNVPFCKMGRHVFYDPALVRAKMFPAQPAVPSANK